MGILDGFLPWLVSDPSQSGGGILAQALGLNKANPGLTTSTPITPPFYGAGLLSQYSNGPLLGNSPLVQGIRGGLTGLAGSSGYTGASALGAGFVSAEDQAQKRRQWDLANQTGALDLYRQRLLMSGMPGMPGYGNAGADSTGAAMPPGVVGPAGGHFPTAPQSSLDPTAQGGQAESVWDPTQGAGYNSTPLASGAVVPKVLSQPPAAPSGGGILSGQFAPSGNSSVGNGVPSGGGASGMNAAFKAATGYDSPAQMFQYGQWRMYAGDANGGKTLMDEALQYDPGLTAQAALLKSQNTITEGRSGSQPLLNGQPIGRGVPTIQQLTDQRSGTKYFAQIYPNGDVVPLQAGGAPANNGGGVSTGGGAGGLPDSLWTAQQYVESHFNPKLISPKGATGPAQFMPGTAAQYGGNSTDQQKAYMGDLYQKYGSLPLALIAYNWGPGNTDMWLKSGADPQKLPAETQTYMSKVLDLAGSGGAPGGSQSSGGIGGGNGLLVSQLGPEQEGSLTERGKVLEDTVGQQIDTDANAAKQQNFLLDQLKSESQGWGAGMGPFAPHIASAQKYIQQIFPDDPDLAKSVGNYQAFNKNAMEIVRVQVRNTSSRASTQEFQMIQQTLPGATMSRPAFDQITDQLGALNDYKLAKQAAASAWRQQHGTLEGFETDYNRNVSPGAFLVMRLQPDALSAMTANMQKTAEGRAALARLQSEIAYGQQNGLFGNQ